MARFFSSNRWEDKKPSFRKDWLLIFEALDGRLKSSSKQPQPDAISKGYLFFLVF
jgi:hypothetical protein